LIGLHCLRKALAELRAPASPDAAGSAAARGARLGGVIYGIYDAWTRMRGQTRNLAEAESLCKRNVGWMIREIKVSKVNTAYSVIHHGRGVENEMYRSGVDSKEI